MSGRQTSIAKCAARRRAQKARAWLACAGCLSLGVYLATGSMAGEGALGPPPTTVRVIVAPEFRLSAAAPAARPAVDSSRSSSANNSEAAPAVTAVFQPSPKAPTHLPAAQAVPAVRSTWLTKPARANSQPAGSVTESPFAAGAPAAPHGAQWRVVPGVTAAPSSDPPELLSPAGRSAAVPQAVESHWQDSIADRHDRDAFGDFRERTFSVPTEPAVVPATPTLQLPSAARWEIAPTLAPRLSPDPAPALLQPVPVEELAIPAQPTPRQILPPKPGLAAANVPNQIRTETPSIERPRTGDEPEQPILEPARISADRIPRSIDVGSTPPVAKGGIRRVGPKSRSAARLSVPGVATSAPAAKGSASYSDGVDPATQKPANSWPLQINGMQRLRLPQDVVAIRISNSSVCEVIQVSAREAVVIGKSTGLATIRFAFASGKPDEVHAFRVNRQPEANDLTAETVQQLETILNRKFPDRGIELEWVRRSLVVRGTAASQREAIDILAFVRDTYLVPVDDRLDVPRGRP